MARRLTIMEHKGDPDALLATIKETIDPVARAKAPEYGGISHAVARTDDGLLIVNVWESEEGSEAMRQDPEVQAAIERMASAGVGPPQVRHYELLEYVTPAAAGQGA
jgi:quinol monooxygenase YgiN